MKPVQQQTLVPNKQARFPVSEFVKKYVNSTTVALL